MKNIPECSLFSLVQNNSEVNFFFFFSKAKKSNHPSSKDCLCICSSADAIRKIFFQRSHHIFLAYFLNLNSSTAPNPLFSCTWHILPIQQYNYPVLSSDVDAGDCYGNKMSDFLELDFREVLMSWRVGLGVVASNLGHPLLSQI
jgi:hypothetical protein